MGPGTGAAGAMRIVTSVAGLKIPPSMSRYSKVSDPEKSARACKKTSHRHSEPLFQKLGHEEGSGNGSTRVRYVISQDAGVHYKQQSIFGYRIGVGHGHRISMAVHWWTRALPQPKGR